MPHPKIAYCLVCEDIRPEQGNKLTILGLYGVLPGGPLGVNIVLPQWNAPLKLMFVVGMSNGSVMARPRILNADDSPLVEGESTQIAGAEDAEGLIFGFGFMPVVFMNPGQHFFQLLFDEREAVKYPFTVSHGPVRTFSPSASPSPS